MEKILFIEDAKHKLLPIYGVTLGAHHKQEAVNRPSGAATHHILFVEDGEGVFETEKSKYILSQNTAVFIKKNTPVNYHKKSDKFVTAWITFDGDCVDNILNYFLADDFSYSHNEALLYQITTILKLYDNSSSSAYISQAIYNCVISYFSHLNESNEPKALTDVKNYISKNYHKDISISDIVNNVGVSQSFIFKLFRENEKTTPIEYIKNIRIEHAKKLLVSNINLNVRDVGKLCGFSDSSYFCMVFKSKTGITPNAFRQIYKI